MNNLLLLREVLSLSVLQMQIMDCIAVNLGEANYTQLSICIKKDRITIYQSITSLLRRRLIKKVGGRPNTRYAFTDLATNAFKLMDIVYKLKFPDL